MNSYLFKCLLAVILLFQINTTAYADSASNLSQYSKAKQLAAEGDYQKAADILKTLIQQDKAESLYELLAEYQLQNQNMDDALNTINDGLKLYPNNINLVFLKGQLYDFYKKDLKTAYEYYMKLTKLSDEPRFIILASSAAESLGKHSDAVKLLDHLINKYPDNATYYAYRGSVYYKAGKEKTAIKDLKTAIKMNNDLTARLLLAEIYVNNKQNEKAIAILEEISKENSNLNIEEYIGKIYLNDQNYAKAIEAYRNLASKLNGKPKIQALQLLGSILIESGQMLEAAKVFEEVTTLDPTNSQNFFVAAKLYEYSSELKKAEEMYLAVLNLRADFSAASKRLTVVYLLQNQPDKALIYINNVDPVEQDVDYFLLKAECYTLKKDFKESINILESGLKENPTNTQILYYLASLYEEVDNQDKALELIQKAIKIEPDNHNFQNFLGYMYAERGENLDEALKLIQKALAKEPKNPAYIDSLAWVYYKKKDYKKALKYINEALKITPEEQEMISHKKAIEKALNKK